MRHSSGFLALVLLGITACGGESPQAVRPDAPGNAVASSGTAGEWRLAGVLKDEAGRSLGNARILACMSRVCLFGQSGADGRFSFTIDSPADLVVKTEPDLSAVPRRAPAMVPVPLAAGRQVDVGAVHVSNLPDGQRLGPPSADPQTLQAGDGLELTLRRAALEPALGEVLFDVAARRLPAANVPRYAALGGEEVLAVYAMHPFAARSTMPIAVKAPSNLPAGTRVKFRTINEIDGTFSEPVSGLASGEFVATDKAAGITELTHLVISR